MLAWQESYHAGSSGRDCLGGHGWSTEEQGRQVKGALPLWKTAFGRMEALRTSEVDAEAKASA